MEKNRENLNNPNQDLPQDLNPILGLDTQLNMNNLIIRPMRKEDIEGVHMVTKHVKPRSAKQQGGIIKAEGPVLACKVMLVCPKCDKKTRVGRKILEDGKKVRYCKHCKETF